MIDINPKTLIAVIRCVNTQTNIPDQISSIIKDKDILAGLEPVEACWLGYYYGKALENKSIDEVTRITAEVNFLLRNIRGKYRIHSLGRNHILSYTDTSTNIIHEKFVIDVAQSEAIINQFDPSQACYIGILAGQQGEAVNHNRKPTLRLVQ